MSDKLADIAVPSPFPDHTQLPESDGTFVFAERAEGKNFQEHPQSIILTESIDRVLQRLHPDGQYCIGQDCGVYWRETEPPEKGAEAPDWFYVPNVPPKLDGKIRRSYVFWREYIPPLIAIELASGNGDEERDDTSLSAALREGKRPGKFWVYRQIIRIPYYAIFEVNSGKLEVYHLIDFHYHKVEPNERGHYPIPLMGVELGLWQGSFLNNPEQLWLRWWDEDGNLLLVGKEEAELERYRTEQERQRAEQAERKAALLAERLRAMGVDPDTLE